LLKEKLRPIEIPRGLSGISLFVAFLNSNVKVPELNKYECVFIYLCVRFIYFTSVYQFNIWFWISSDSVVLYVFHFHWNVVYLATIIKKLSLLNIYGIHIIYMIKKKPYIDDHFIDFINITTFCFIFEGSSWSWSHRSWIYNCICKQWLSSLKLRVRIPSWRGVPDTTYVKKFISDLRQVSDFFRYIGFPTIKPNAAI
jgi:hypothetical protein